MNTRRTTLALGAAGGGLLAAAFFQTAVALAAPTTDTLTDVASTTSPEQISAITGFPPFDQQVDGTQLFNIDDVTGAHTVGSVTTPDVIGTFGANESVTTTPFGFDNTEITVTSPGVLTGATVDGGTVPAADLPTVGSVLDTATFGGFTNEYSDIVTASATAGSPATDVVTDTLVLPSYLGGSDIDLTPYISGFDASAGLSGDTFGPFVEVSQLGTLATTLGTDFGDFGLTPAAYAADVAALLAAF